MFRTSIVVAALALAGVAAGAAGSAPKGFHGANGRILYDADYSYGLLMINPDGSGRTYVPHTGDANSPAWSPDGTKIAFQGENGGDYDIYVVNADGSKRTELTFSSAFDGDPAWSPDGTQIAFECARDGNKEIYVMNADGSGQTRLTNDAQEVKNLDTDAVD